MIYETRWCGEHWAPLGDEGACPLCVVERKGLHARPASCCMVAGCCYVAVREDTGRWRVYQVENPQDVFQLILR